MRSWRWWVSLESLPLWAALVALLWAGANHLANRMLRVQLDRYRADGTPLSLAELAPSVAPGPEDAGMLYAEAGTRIARQSAGTDVERAERFGQSWGEEAASGCSLASGDDPFVCRRLLRSDSTSVLEVGRPSRR